MGYWFRLHRRDLPGRPDVVLPKWRTVILVHGCFWHGHAGCCEGHVPKSNLGYWAPKLKRNLERDRENAEKPRLLGWHRVVVWECQTDNLKTLEERLREAMRPVRAEAESRERKAGLDDQHSPGEQCQTICQS
jgi:DNA mismatch endonuclease (patch repair protein)